MAASGTTDRARDETIGVRSLWRRRNGARTVASAGKRGRDIQRTGLLAVVLVVVFGCRGDVSGLPRLRRTL